MFSQPSVKAAVSLVWLAVFLCSRGMAQLCAEERMCEVSINATVRFQRYELNDGVKTCFSCLFNSIIETDTTWFIDDSPDIPLTTGANPFGTNNNGVLEICNTTNILDSVADSTPRFVCDSLTAHASHFLFITLRVPPAAAEGLMVPEVFKTSVELEWTIGFVGFSNVTEVEIEVFLQSDSARVFPTVSLDGELQNANITNLTPLTSYIFRVYLINNRFSGRSDPAETVGTTLSLPLEVPTNLACSATSSSTLQCSWQAPPPLATTNPADTWVIQYQEVGVVDPLVYRNTSDNSTTFVLDGLTSFTVYTARVAGINSCGVGSYSEFFNATTLAGPPNHNSAVAPIAFAIDISWTPPDAIANLVVTGYTISLGEVDSTTSEVGQFVELVPQLSASARMLFLWNPTIEPRGNPRIQLTADTTYEVRVAAVHSAGVGEPAATTVTTPSADVPQPIYTPPVVTDITQSSVVLTWFVPGGAVNLYTVEYCNNAIGDCSNFTTTDGRPTVTLDGLMKLTAYYVRVATIIIASGTSQYSPSATFTTLAVPAPVITVTVDGWPQSGGAVTVPEGVTFVLTCSSTSTVGTASWSRDASSLPPQAIVVGGVLTLTDVVPDSTGSYVCDYGGVNASFWITVLAVPTPTITATVDGTALTNGSVMAVGTDIVLTCSSSSMFRTIYWTFASSPLPPEAAVIGGLLILPDVTVARSGFYLCTVDGKSASFEITVGPVPVVNNGEPVDDQDEGDPL